jgi:hypothetical protein
VSHGKRDQFPLQQGSIRAMREEDSIASEWPILLDPTRDPDPLLLHFWPTGRVEERDHHRQLPRERARASIDIFHLNHSDLVDQRRQLAEEIKWLIKDGMVHYDQWQAGNVSAQIGFNSAVEKLQKLTSEEAEYSAAAQDIIKWFRDPNHLWIEAIC